MIDINQDKLTKMADEAAKNASNALSILSGKKNTVEVSNVQISKLLTKFPGIEKETMVLGIYLPITGEIKGASLLIFPEEIAYILCDLLMRRKPGSTHTLTEFDKSALKEVGNIICGSFLSVFANTLRIKIIEHIPSFSFDMFGAVVDVIIAEFARKAEAALVIEVKFVFENTDIKGFLALIFGIEEMEAIAKALKLAEA